MTNLAPGVRITDIHALSASKIADLILIEARELGIPEGEVHGVPADLPSFPDWFVKTELAWCNLLNNWNNPEFLKKL